MSTTTSSVTADKLIAMPEDGFRYELVTATEKDTLDGGDVVPGFRLAVSEIFGN